MFFLHTETTREETLTVTYFKDKMKCERALGYLVVSYHLIGIGISLQNDLHNALIYDACNSQWFKLP